MRRAVVVLGFLCGAFALGACSGEEDENDADARDGGSAEGSATGGTGGGSGGVAGGGGSSGSAGSGGSAASGGSAGSGGASGSAGSGGVAGTGGAGMAGSGGMAGGSAVERVTYSFGMRNVTELNGTWYHAYYEQEPGTGEWDVYVRTSSDGSTWSSGVRANTTTAGGQTRPNIVAWDDAGTARVAVSYVDEAAAMPRMYSAVSSDGAQTFTETIAVDTAAENQELRGSMDRGTDGTLWVSYVRRPNGSHDGVYFTTSSNDGQTWATPALVGDTGSFGWNHDIVAGDAGEAWVVSKESVDSGNVIVYRTSNSGGTWQRAAVLTGTNGDPADMPVMRRASDGTLHVAGWMREAAATEEWDLFYSQSTDDGANWSTPVQVNEPVDTGRGNGVNSPPRSYPSMAIGGNGRIYLAWADDRAAPNDNIDLGDYDVYVSYSSDGGATWSGDQRINGTPSTGQQVFPSIALDPGSTTDTVVTVWTDRDPGMSSISSDVRMLP